MDSEESRQMNGATLMCEEQCFDRSENCGVF